MAKYTEMAKGVLKDVGGLENITFVEHCATRLRFTIIARVKWILKQSKKRTR